MKSFAAPFQKLFGKKSSSNNQKHGATTSLPDLMYQEKDNIPGSYLLRHSTDSEAFEPAASPISYCELFNTAKVDHTPINTFYLEQRVHRPVDLTGQSDTLSSTSCVTLSASDGNISKSNSNVQSLSRSVADFRSAAGTLKNTFKRFISLDRKIRISEPGDSESAGPWSDSSETATIPAWKMSQVILNENICTVHVMTVGGPVISLDMSGEEHRRVRIYEHYIQQCENLSEIGKKLVKMPEEILSAADSVLRNPFSEYKLTDRLLSRNAAVSALSTAQIGLIPLFGNWLNPLICTTLDVVVSFTSTIYLCGHSPENGTYARIVKSLEAGSTREQVTAHLKDSLAPVLESFWDDHPSTGWSMCVVVPPEKDVATLAVADKLVAAVALVKEELESPPPSTKSPLVVAVVAVSVVETDVPGAEVAWEDALKAVEEGKRVAYVEQIDGNNTKKKQANNSFEHTNVVAAVAFAAEHFSVEHEIKVEAEAVGLSHTS
ncbi:hypothetical protein HK100_000193 [Physocladia obscura]|uniref:Uncharacterized protein n=1 Tax=Physocladia obscura TaxID=109957 RepID=A0AAD5SZ36_9FUNG|nr:hypothetical protein HK100_000193 [Physocladia obscura]